MGSALFAKMFRFYKTDKGDWAAEKVIDIPNKGVSYLYYAIICCNTSLFPGRRLDLTRDARRDD